MTLLKAFSISIFLMLSTVAQAAYPDFSKVVEKVRPSVVVIKTEVESRGRKAPGPSGSGFVIDEGGYVLTNRHVIHGVESIFVQLVNKKIYKAELLGEDSGTDIALLKIDAPDLQKVTVGNVEKLKVGAWVLAYGAPFGLEHTVTAGIVSAKGRSLRTEQYVPFIQTDAAVNRGNSGGPLFNADGEVVGINSQIFSMSGGNMGLAFAIPMDLAIDVSEQLRKDGRVSRGYLGVGYEELDYDLAKALGVEEVRGAVINAVSPDSPAEKGGLEVGDIVLEVNDHKLINAADLPFMVGRIRPGEEVDLVVMREGKLKTLEVTVGERPDAEVAAQRRPGESSESSLGLYVTELPDRLQEAADVDYGVLVRRVVAGPAQDAGIREGDILQMLNQQRIADLDDYEAALERLPESGSVAVLVNRRGYGPRFLVLKLEQN
ncbi:Do family serine endopeptidase [Pleionea mediterranea]|uniref:Probable periplasmic serine endoprotease DegP-like n=1 Tax=Pleionea mediterranea TaxID=523701 RepID=A0A316G3W1_9GAMM|nr:Do family serine endopeptidase [Pleionea mediterranea]PWK54470.1 serine protease Do [Pleionea mediterranea]